MNIHEIIDNAIVSHNVDGKSWGTIRQSIPLDGSQTNNRARMIIAMIEAGWFTENEIDTFTVAQFEAKGNRIRVEEIVFGMHR